MTRVACFLVVSTGIDRLRLRRYRSSDTRCAGLDGYHHAMSEEVGRCQSDVTVNTSGPNQLFPHDDPRWPTRCACGYQFQEDDPWQVFAEEVYTNAGKEYFLRDRTPGMMYDAIWLHDRPQWCGPDGKSLHVVCPDGHTWCIDSRASNCDQKDEHTHKCWVRHGEPPVLTVDKNGHTCGAGAGSIQTPTWHGFLTNGILSESR